MKKTIILVLSSIFASSLFAHNLWVQASNEEVVKANMIYGHNFPHPEKIAQDREQLFEPIKIIGENTQLVLFQKGENYSYVGKEKLKKGTYIVQATYIPTPWIETADGKWEMKKTRKDTQKDVKSCGVYSMSAKSFLNIDNSDGEFVKKVLGVGLEITPLVSLSKMKKGEPLKFRVTFNGKRVKFLEIFGSFEGYSKDGMSKPFYAKTDLKGEFVFKPLKNGLWYLETNYKRDSGNEDCEKIVDKASVAFEVK
jgi:uncharacterized GH25 family protein